MCYLWGISYAYGHHLIAARQRRQAWTRVPPSKLVVSALHQLREISKLLIKASFSRQRLEEDFSYTLR